MKKICLNCSEKFETQKKYQKFCSCKCSSSYKPLIEIRVNKTKKTKLKKYGDENYVNSEKAKQTNLEKYGVDNPLKSPKIRKKVENTLMEKYGVKHNWNNGELRDKIKNTMIERYGVEHQMYDEDIKNKVKTTTIKNGNDTTFINKDHRKLAIEKFEEKYGVKYPFQSPEILKKINNINEALYGYANPMKSDLIKQKRIKIFREQYGVDNPAQINEIRSKISKTQKDKFYDMLYKSDRLKNEVEPLFLKNEYNGVSNNNLFKCLKCNKEFESTFISGRIPRCPICYSIYKSKPEKDILKYIKSIYDGKIIENDKKILNKLELDIYLPEKNLAIEFDGLHWHSDLTLNDKKYHLNKTLKCEKQNIQLIHIFEDEWINKQEIVKNKLKNLLGLSTEKIYARNCKIRELLSQEKKYFLNMYHIQGDDKSSIKIGLFYENDLVAVMTFGNRRVAMGKKSTEKGEYELLRYATSKNVVGGAGKLLSYFIKNYQPKKIVSYADRRWSQGNLYEKLGFELVSKTPLNYWYIKGLSRIHRFNFRKNVLSKKLEIFSGELTEWQNMQLNGYDRIWDCGSLKYRKDIL